MHYTPKVIFVRGDMGTPEVRGALKLPRLLRLLVSLQPTDSKEQVSVNASNHTTKKLLL